MEKKSKAEKLKLRVINQTILISSYNSGAGTGPNDCMTEEVINGLMPKEPQIPPSMYVALDG